VGLFKQLKDMKGMVEDGPERIRMAQAMGQQAQQLAAAQQAAGQQALANAAALSAQSTPAPLAAAANEEPIAGVSLEQYAEISRSLAAVGYDQSRAHELAAAAGVSAERWDAAVSGWNQRITASAPTASRFNALYTGRA
jgi:hypothetical protein